MVCKMTTTIGEKRRGGRGNMERFRVLSGGRVCYGESERECV